MVTSKVSKDAKAVTATLPALTVPDVTRKDNAFANQELLGDDAINVKKIIMGSLRLAVKVFNNLNHLLIT